MSYQQKRYGQYVEVAGMGADDPWADAASGEIAQTGVGPGHATPPSSGLTDLFGSLFGGGSTTPAKPSSPSTVSQVGSGIGAFLKGLSTPPPGGLKPGMPGYPGYPAYPQPGMSSTTKLALAGGGALVLVLLLTR